MSGFIEFCVELRSGSEGGAAAENDGESLPQAANQEARHKNGRGGRHGMLLRQNSVVCSRVHTLNTISYVDTGGCDVPESCLINHFYFSLKQACCILAGKEIKRLKPKRAASFFTRQTSAPAYSAVQVTESLEQG